MKLSCKFIFGSFIIMTSIIWIGYLIGKKISQKTINKIEEGIKEVLIFLISFTILGVVFALHIEISTSTKIGGFIGDIMYSGLSFILLTLIIGRLIRTIANKINKSKYLKLTSVIVYSLIYLIIFSLFTLDDIKFPLTVLAALLGNFIWFDFERGCLNKIIPWIEKESLINYVFLLFIIIGIVILLISKLDNNCILSCFIGVLCAMFCSSLYVYKKSI